MSCGSHVTPDMAKREPLREADLPAKKRMRRGGRDPGVTKHMFNETSSYIENGLRHVIPYYFVFETHTKGRWVGRKLFEVFCKEFQSDSPEYYENAIDSGRIKVNQKAISMVTVLKDNDLITHQLHRHEPPVTARQIEIVVETSDVVVINKPSSIPVHPCGRFRHNSVIFILGKEFGLTNLRTTHRLDRLTSGLLILARNLSTAQKIEAEIRDRKVVKEYVCRVEGEFPKDPLECIEPIHVVSHRLGVCTVDPRGKECLTCFERLSFNGTTSVVKCIPKTGRMHQIRVHLQWLGHPIVNDPIYNHVAWKLRRPDADITEVLQEIAKSRFELEGAGNLEPLVDSSKVVLQTQTSLSAQCQSNSLQLKSSDLNQSKIEDPFPQRDSKGGKPLGGVDTKEDTPPGGGDTKEDTPPGGGDNKEDTPPGGGDTKEDTPPGGDITFFCDSSKEIPEEHQEGKEKNSVENITVGRNNVTKGFSVTSSHSEGSHAETPKGEVPTPQEIIDDSVVPDPDQMEDKNIVKEVDTSLLKDPYCTECRIKRPDPTPEELVMFLHAFRYKGSDWEYMTELPIWADENYKD